MNYYLQVLKKYFDFSGRARRQEYWMFTLINFIFIILTIILDINLGTSFIDVGTLGFGLFYFVYALGVFIPGLAVSIRRLHDIGNSGWMILITLIPIVGAFWFLILLVTASNPEENLFGPNPKESQDAHAKTERKIRESLFPIVVLGTFLITVLLIYFYPRLYLADDKMEATYTLFIVITSLVALSLAFSIKNKYVQAIMIFFGVLILIYSLFIAIGSIY